LKIPKKKVFLIKNLSERGRNRNGGGEDPSTREVGVGQASSKSAREKRLREENGKKYLNGGRAFPSWKRRNPRGKYFRLRGGTSMGEKKWSQKAVEDERFLWGREGRRQRIER